MVQEVGPCVMNEVSKILLYLCSGVDEVRQLLKLDCRGGVDGDVGEEGLEDL